MKEIRVHQAGSFGETEVQPVTITIKGNLPEDESPLGMLETFLDEDSDALANALFYSLPQGTFDRLIIKLMKRKVSIYRGITKS